MNLMNIVNNDVMQVNDMTKLSKLNVNNQSNPYYVDLSKVKT